MTDLLNDDRYWTAGVVLDEPTDVPVTSDDERAAFDGRDDDEAYDR